MINGTSGGALSRDLPAVVKGVAQQQASPQELLDAWLDATVYCVRPDRPGVYVAETPAPEDQVVGVCTSLEELARFAGECEWFSTTGSDLLAQLPPGVDVVIDPSGSHPLRLSPGALEIRQGLRLNYQDTEGGS
ncbi:SseB family protein [Streptomyces griseorubiginosus]|uniref:SseB family protein n=1 Tax=Streptomyces griseorubiginosus TaxID=67304 RepID=UPI0033E2D376